MLVNVLDRLVGRGLRAFFFRRNVTSYVQGASEFWFPTVRFHRWIGQLDRSRLQGPLESVGAQLGVDLDQALAGNPKWAGDRERHSKVLRLIALLYDGILIHVPGSESAVLTQRWATARHQDLVGAIGSLVGSGVRYTRADLIGWLWAQSTARRHARMAATGLDVELSSSFELLRRHLPLQQAGVAHVVVGPFGSGKSELAEEWHRRGLEQLEQNALAPLPIWLDAQEVGGTALEAAVAQLVSADRVASGISIVIDGLDEIDSVTASRLADQARTFSRANAASSLLLTCRPGVLGSHTDDIYFDGLDAEEARDFVERISGREYHTWSWNPILVDAIRRPFFAIAAGQLVAEGRRATSQAQLIASLVERALGVNSAASLATRSTEVFMLLVSAAVQSTRTAGRDDGLTFQQRQVVRHSTLIRLREDGTAEFTLPIFQQWFAGAAILETPAIVEEAFSSSAGFDRWRWALAVGALSATPSQLDELIGHCVRLNPGAASWLLKRLAEGHQQFREPTDELDEATDPARLLVASRTWMDATGPLGALAIPWAAETRIGLGVRIEGNRVSVGWRRDPPTVDSVSPLPPGLHVLSNDQTWLVDRQGSVAEGNEWPWLLARHRIKHSVLQVLNEDLTLGPEMGVWRMEAMYQVARLLADVRTVLFAPLSAADVRARATRLLGYIENPAVDIVVIGNRYVPAQVIADLVAWIDSDGRPEIVRPYATPDVELGRAQSSWIWALYSDARVQEFYAGVLGNAATAYEEVTSTLLPDFGWSLATSAEGPIGVIADVSFHANGWGGARTPGYTSAVVPLAMLTELAAAGSANGSTSSNGRALVTLSPDRDDGESWVEDFVRSRRAGRTGLAFSRAGNVTTSIADEVGHSRPASSIAARWLFNDLKDLDMADGTFPQLER